MNKFYAFFISLFFSFQAYSQKAAYKIYDKGGNPVVYDSLISAVKNQDIVLFGELHNNPIVHWMRLEIIKSLNKQRKSLILGGEFFESDVQVVIDEYMSGFIPMSHLIREARPWDNFRTDYEPMFEFAYANKLPFVASNIPRRYAGLVAREGLNKLDELDARAKEWIAPLPFSYDPLLPGYKRLLDAPDHGHSMPYMADAQAIKDGTMAHFILMNWTPGKLFFHINGAYHSDNFEGIYWHLKRHLRQLNISTFSSVEQVDINTLDPKFLGKADFIIVVPSDMTKTH
ncbi:MAG: ChaN family lipoprotein [Cytophagaceae bacterium]